MKNKFNIILLSFKNNVLPALIIIFIVFLVLFSNENLIATKKGLSLWFNSVVPSLLPFFIATELLGHTQIVYFIGNLLNKYMKPIFNVPGIGAYAFVMGIISGYPVGAKIVTKFRQDGVCTKREAERLLAFTNNSGPLFIIGTVGISLFGNTTIGFLLFLTHFLSCIIVGFIFRFWNVNDKEIISSRNIKMNNTENLTFSNLGEILASSIMKSVNTVVMIGGFVVIFSVIISILNNAGIFSLCSSVLTPIFASIKLDTSYIKPLISGFVELTNGLSQITLIPTKSISVTITLVAFLLGFGGISVALQVLSITSKSDISIKPYFLGKFLHGIIAAILTYTFIHIFPVFDLDITPIFSQNVNNVSLTNSYTNPYSLLILALFIFSTIYLIINRKRYKAYKNYH